MRDPYKVARQWQLYTNNRKPNNTGHKSIEQNKFRKMTQTKIEHEQYEPTECETPPKRDTEAHKEVKKINANTKLRWAEITK